MALESLAYWKALSQRQNTPVFYPTGVLWFSPERDQYMQRSLTWLKEQKISHRSGNAEWLSEHWPQIRFNANEVGFIEEGSGGLIANRAVQATVSDAELKPVIARVGSLRRGRAGSFELPDGQTAQKLVYALGPWLGELFPDILGGRLSVTRQEVYYFGPPNGDERFAAGRLPVWADFNGGDIVYGLPDLEGRGFKIAFDRHGPPADPNGMEREPSSQGIAMAREFIARRFPALADAPLVQARVCQYTNSSSGDFLIDWLPGDRDVLLVGGGSGHGFKHGPAVGKRVADLLVSGSQQNEPRFSLETKGVVTDRQVY
jgi:glycine/D-amino acid oxidase-like deaminating enzyme